MRTETYVYIKIGSLRVTYNLFIEPDGFIIKVFFACSRSDTKVFKITDQVVNINQTLTIRNVIGNYLEFWLCNCSNKIIGNALLQIGDAPEQYVAIDFKMINTYFARMYTTISVVKRNIDKIIYVEPDEALLKKEYDPYEKIRLEEYAERKNKELADQLSASKNEKKHAITLTQYNHKDIPFA